MLNREMLHSLIINTALDQIMSLSYLFNDGYIALLELVAGNATDELPNSKFMHGRQRSLSYDQSKGSRRKH